ncbi:MAG: class II fructose-bisphosphate aldolase [Candidatus Hydrogenedentes bacterium]|nr:class II fructose-bisphosphate aldolase [Candidatus Hydrogenedentota bacterium]
MPASSAELVRAARKAGLAVPAFNVPYLPMAEPIIRAVVDSDAVAFLEVARLEWIKFEARGLAEALSEYRRYANPKHVRLHLDHVPVIDEDGLLVDYLEVIQSAIALGYDSVMVDGSRLPLDENIAATRAVADAAHAAGIPCEAELGAILGHESGPLPPYEELFAAGKGFTRVDEAERFARESACDWLSVAAGNIHGAISAAFKDRKKDEARLDLDHLGRLADATGLPLVLHGGTGIKKEYLLGAIACGIAKVNVATEIRQPYEVTLKETGDVRKAQEAVYERTMGYLESYIELSGTRGRICSAVAAA